MFRPAPTDPRTLRILHVVHDTLPFSLGGVEVYVDRLTKAQAGQAAEVEVLAAVDGGLPNTYARGLIEGRVPIHTIASRFGREPSRFSRLARDRSLFYRCPEVDAVVTQVLEERRPNVVHVHHLVHLSGSLIETVKAHDLPVVVTLHDYWTLCISGQLINAAGAHLPDRCDADCLCYVLGNRYKSAGALRWVLSQAVRLAATPFNEMLRERRAFLMRQLQLADRILAPSRFLADVFVGAGLSPARLSCSGYGVPEELIAPVLASGSRSPLRIGFIGRIVPEKGLHVLIDAMNALDDRFTLSIHGAGPADYEAEVRRRATHPSIRFCGAIPSGGLGDVLSALDVLVVPSIWWENAPIVILEAFAHGTPVIASRLGGMAELVSEGRSGLLFPVGDVQALRRALERVASEDGLLPTLREGRPPAKTIRDDARELLELYATLAGRRRPA